VASFLLEYGDSRVSRTWAAINLPLGLPCASGVWDNAFVPLAGLTALPRIGCTLLAVRRGSAFLGG
jgi:hypothetical protein